MTNEEAIKELRDASDSEVRYGDTKNHYDKVMKRVEALDLAIKALEQQRPKGRWLEQKDIHKHHYGWSFCSECGAFLMSSDGANYCSCCGAKMEVDE
jgi:predicted amidophosphoribosyltransferase